ncbi:MAG TPA: hypothetical protein VMY37_10205 [Thermoguttaceae bacterium]|nr:hypothetical protein [Thermoguttaceae bacterium]
MPGETPVSDLVLADAAFISKTDLLVNLSKKFGGTEGMADLIWDEYQHLPEGSPAKRDILIKVAWAVFSHGTDEGAEEDDPAEVESGIRRLMVQWVREEGMPVITELLRDFGVPEELLTQLENHAASA